MDPVQKVNDLVALDENIHLFCPRNGPEDGSFHYDEDLKNNDPETLKDESHNDRNARHKRIEEAEKRIELVLDACTILAYDSENARPYQDKLKKALARQLNHCDICVREFHRSRNKLKSTLEEQYGTDEVDEFMNTFDKMNKERIAGGLNSMKKTLLGLPEKDRKIQNAGEAGMYGLFESLNCIPFLNDEQALQDSFDEPFRLVQSQKKVKLPTISPGMISFLYSQNETRSTWAHRNLGQIKRDATPEEFKYSIQPFLAQALNRVHISYLDEAFIPRFWNSTRLILSKTSAEEISTELVAMDANIWTMSLEHFQLKQSHLLDLLASHKILLEKCPKEFWESMGNISPQAILDTIFAAPRLEDIMRETDENQSKLGECLSWIELFISSIKANNLVQPIRTLLHQMLKRPHEKKYPKQTIQLLHTKGLQYLLQTLQLMREQGTNGPVVPQMMELISKEYLTTLSSEWDGVEKKTDDQLYKNQNLALQILELSLTLDCSSITADRSTIIKTANIDHELTASGVEIWKRSIQHVKSGHPHVACAIVNGIQGLLGLEPLAKRQVEAARKPAESWNNALGRVSGYTNDLMDQLQSLTTDQLLALFNRATAGMFSLLFNGHGQIHQMCLDLFKTLSGEDSRRDSLMFIVKNHFHASLKGVATAQRTIARSRSFEPCSIMLKLVSDLFNCFCDDSDGLLKSGRDFDKQDLIALENVWQFAWINLNVIFEQTEDWSNLGYDKKILQDFCRATMDLAEYVFDQYALIASITNSASDHAQQRLLEKPRITFTNMTKWLRLRDDYLVIKAVSLLCKMLLRFKEADIKVSDHASDHIKNVFTGKTKTKLTMNQKAEVQRSLENHLGEVFERAQPTKPVSMKQGSLQGWTDSPQTSGRSTPVQKSKPGTLDVDAWSAAAKKQNYSSDAMEDVSGDRYMTSKVQSKKSFQDEKKMQEFRLKRQKEKQEAERRKLESLSRAKVGVGSGITGLGNLGKDHNLKGDNLMLSSDEESAEESEEDLDEGLFGPSVKKDKKKINRNDLDLNGVVGLKPEQKKGPTRIQRTARNAKDMRARLAPDLKPLHRTILAWDFFHQGDYPPNSNEHQFRRVAKVFHDPMTYRETFQPLLTLEAWQGLIKSREESTSKAYEIKIVSRSSVDSFIEITSSISSVENKDVGLTEGDIILFSTSKNPLNDSDAAHCLARIYRMKRQKNALETVYQFLPGNPLDRQLTPQAVIYGSKVQSIVPLEREYGAMQALQYYDLCNQIVRARPSDRIAFSEKQIQRYQDTWNVNRAQCEAINAALTNEGFSLIQGPPGSGKTKTIVAIVGGLLTDTLASPSSFNKINVPGQNGKTDSEASVKKLLVCAPSNAAVDELVIRMKTGVKGKNGKTYPLNVVRIGRSEAVNAQVQDVTMDSLVDKQLGNNHEDEATRAKKAELFKEHEKVSAELRSLYDKKESGQVKGKDATELQEQISAVRRRKNELGSRIDNLKDQEKSAGREAELNRKRAQQAVLDQAHVICATLSGSGHDMFQNLNIEFDTVIIDEAAQCVEMSSLIPLKYGCIKCIMVGDPKQLPPTVFSKEAARFQYEQSLFVRMQNNFPNEVHLLDTQYRMHPDISLFPSRTFYDGLLKDGRSMAGLRQQPWHESELLAPYRFYDVQGQHQAAPKGHSLVNVAEIEVAMALYVRLRTDFKNYDFTSKIGIITPYKSQHKMLKERFASRFGNDVFEMIDFNTTDAFQGREAEIIIFSCVRASPAGGVGFLQDIRRMNVGLTRAKSSLWVLGNSESLVRGEYWKKLVEDAKARDCYTTGDIHGMLKQPSSAFKVEGKKDMSMHDISEHKRQMDPDHAEKSSPEKPNDSHAQQKQSDRDGKSETETNKVSDQDQVKSSGDRMEGVKYRFEDRIKKRPAPNDESSRSRPKTEHEDVEMMDAGSESTTRDSTPKPDTKASHNTTNGGNGTTSVKPGPKPPQHHKPAPRREKASPFIQPKKQYR